MNLPSVPLLRNVAELRRNLPDFLRRLVSELEREDTQNLKRRSDVDHPHSLTVREREIHPFKTFADQDATPDVSQGRNFKTANTVATTITDFDNGVEGQTICIVTGDANTTFDFTGTNLKGITSDWTAPTERKFYFTYDGTYWYINRTG